MVDGGRWTLNNNQFSCWLSKSPSRAQFDISSSQPCECYTYVSIPFHNTVDSSSQCWHVVPSRQQILSLARIAGPGFKSRTCAYFLTTSRNHPRTHRAPLHRCLERTGIFAK